LADTHADGTEEEKVSTTEFLDHVQTRESGGNVDTVCDDLGDKGVVETSVREVLSSVVDLLRLA
jgi:hypothetical protein